MGQSGKTLPEVGAVAIQITRGILFKGHENKRR
jgi:hypothetical protein